MAHHPSDAHENFQLIYFEVLDSIISVIKERFNQPRFQAYMRMESFLLKAIDGSCTKEEHDLLLENYHGDIEVDYLEAFFVIQNQLVFEIPTKSSKHSRAVKD